MSDENTVEREESYEANSYWSNVSNPCTIFGANLLDLYNPEYILNIIKDPMHNYDQIREISRSIYSSNGIVTNAIDYCVALPTLSRVIVPYGDSPSKKKRNKKKVTEALGMIRDKEVVRDCIHGALIDGEYFAYLEVKKRPLSKDQFISDYDVRALEEINESDEYNAAIISLDPDYTRIIGTKNGSYILAVDLQYFITNGTESPDKKIRKFPEEIRKGFERWRAGKGNRWLRLDTDHTIAIKFRARRNEIHGRPMVLAAIDDVMYDAYNTKAKREALNNSNNRIYYETFPEGKNKGEAALTKEQQRQQHDTVRNGIMQTNAKNNTTFFSVAAGTKIDALKTDIEILSGDSTSSKNSIATSLGFAGSLLSGEGTSSFSAQTNNLQLVTAEVFHIIEEFCYDFNKCINALIVNDKRNRVEVQYLPITYTNMKDFSSMAKDLYLQGKGSLSLWVDSIGISSDAFFSLLDEELELDVENKYPVHATSFNGAANATEKENGRPVDEDTMNADTIETRSQGYNDYPKPSTT